MNAFDPFEADAIAVRTAGRITATCVLKANAPVRLASAEVHGDGQFLTIVFEEIEESE